MSPSRAFPVASYLIVALGVALHAAPAQKTDTSARKGKAASQVERRVYLVLGASPKELANALTLYFKTEPNFLAVPVASSNTLLLSGPKSVVQEAMGVLREIDRPARTIHLEILLLQLNGKAGEVAKDLDGIELSGPVPKVMAKVRELQKAAVISSSKRIVMTALEGQSARTQVSQNRPYVTGISGTAFRGPDGGPGGGPRGGAISQSVTYRNVGTSVQATPEMGADGLVKINLLVEDSQMQLPEGGVNLGEDQKGTPIPAAEFVTSTFESRLTVRPGHVVQAQDIKSASIAGHAQKVILVSASTDGAVGTRSMTAGPSVNVAISGSPPIPMNLPGKR